MEISPTTDSESRRNNGYNVKRSLIAGFFFYIYLNCDILFIVATKT